jgi:ATP-dependent Lon protease
LNGFHNRISENLRSNSLEELCRKAESTEMPSYVQQVVNREIDFLSNISPNTTEFAKRFSYVNYLVTLPWSEKTEDNLDLRRVEVILNENYDGPQKIKEKVLEYLGIKILIMNNKPKVLIVDDEKIALRNLERALIKEGYIVTPTNSGSEALKRLEEESFDVVVTDLIMGDVDGTAVLEKTREKYPDAKIIMITGYATINTAVEAMRKGAFHYIEKPVKLNEVRSVVKEALEHKFSFRSSKGSVLCFAGFPEAEKFSLGKAVAASLGRKFVNIPLDGVKDETEIRGRKRIYPGAKPGCIIEGIRKAGVINPVLMLDNLDRIEQNFPTYSVLGLREVLDQLKNHDFTDNYLDVSYDLSSVIFIITVDNAGNIPDTLKNLVKVINF